MWCLLIIPNNFSLIMQSGSISKLDFEGSGGRKRGSKLFRRKNEERNKKIMCLYLRTLMDINKQQVNID